MTYVLFTNHTLDFRAGGGERVLHNLIGAVDPERFRVALAAGLVSVMASPGWSFPVALGEIQGNFDTTVSIGTTIRVSEPDEDIIGRENGGNAHSVNGDDGNLS